MSWHIEPPPPTPPRVLFVSQRAASAHPSRALRYEYEDLVRSMDPAELIACDGRGPNHLARRAVSLASRFAPGVSALLEGPRPGVARRYELVFVAIESLADLQQIRQLRWILGSARISVCLVDEVWRKGLGRRTGELRLLRQFDRVLLGTSGAVDAIADATGRPTSYLAPSIDALALCPYPEGPARVIDVYAMGRRSQRTHAALLELADRKRWFYLYDTLSGARAIDHRLHRRHLADLLKRTRWFLAYPGKMDVPEETDGQQEIGYRYFEGAAAGAMLVGAAPDNPWFEKLFAWREPIVPLRYGCDDLDTLAAALEVAPEREDLVRRANVVESLRRHDHVYRWAEVLLGVGLPETPAMEARRRKLRALADAVAREHPRGALGGRPAFSP